MPQRRVIDQSRVVVDGGILGELWGRRGNHGGGAEGVIPRRHGDGLLQGKHLIEGKVPAVDGLQLLLQLDLVSVKGLAHTRGLKLVHFEICFYELAYFKKAEKKNQIIKKQK